jgi:hypothetical protein
MLRKLLNSNLSMLMFLLLPVGVVLAYNDYQNRLLESQPEVYGSLYETPKSKRLTKILPDQHEILAANAYAEARGEGFEGMIAVTNVVRHRKNDPEFPKTYYDVITQPNQFSWLNSGKSIVIDDEKSWELAQRVADLELKGKLPDLVNGARFYANPRKVDISRHQWVVKYQPLAEVGRHVYMDKPEYVKTNNLKPLPKTNLSKSAQKAMTAAVPKPGTKTKQPTTNTKPTKVKT